MKVCAAIVTYGDRLDQVALTLDAVLEQDVEGVLVVLNGASERVVSHVRGLPDPRVWSRMIETNVGSAGGFGLALASVASTAFDVIWLLDDDNVPAPDALGNLRRASVRHPGRALCSLRPHDVSHEQLLRGLAVEDVYDRAPSVLGFDVCRTLRASKRRHERPAMAPTGAIEVPHAPWGGLWIPISIVRQIAGPRDDFVLYQEDIEYTARIPDGVLLVMDSVIDDPDRSASEQDPPKSAADPMRLYYTVRNWLFLDLQRARNARTRLRMAVNGVLVVSKILLESLATDRRGRSALAVAYAVIDALRGRLGERRYTIPR